MELKGERIYLKMWKGMKVWVIKNEYGKTVGFFGIKEERKGLHIHNG